MEGEVFDPDAGLPGDLCSAWLAVGPVPQGKRCMVVTFQPGKRRKKGRCKSILSRTQYLTTYDIVLPCSIAVTNAILFSRVSGRPMARHYLPVVPADCILDCVYAEHLAVLFVVDVMSWKGQSIAECDASFRYAELPCA